MEKQLYCPHWFSMGGAIYGCKLGKIPDCEHCTCVDRTFIETEITTTSTVLQERMHGMTMVKERYVSFETAKLLKEKGFDVECDYYYFLMNEGMMSGYKEFCHDNHNNSQEKCSCPTHQMACDWLREKGYHIEIKSLCSCEDIDDFEFSYYYATIAKFDDDIFSDEWHLDDGKSKDYAECMEYAIKYCLTELMK